MMMQRAGRWKKLIKLIFMDYVDNLLVCYGLCLDTPSLMYCLWISMYEMCVFNFELETIKTLEEKKIPHCITQKMLCTSTTSTSTTSASNYKKPRRPSSPGWWPY
jgi:hypothetical protein